MSRWLLCHISFCATSAGSGIYGNLDKELRAMRRSSVLKRGLTFSAGLYLFSAFLCPGGNAFVEEELNVDPAVFGSSRRGFVGTNWVGFTHRSGRENAPYRNPVLLKEVGGDRLSALLAEDLVGGGITHTVGVSCH